MTRKVQIQMNVGNALRWLGTVYRNPADAIKEHISNAIDEHVKAKRDGRARKYCDVVFTLEKRSIAIDYPYGMDQHEFEDALRRVADSAKKESDIAQIGRLGIGMFGFQQIGRKCTFLSKKNAETDTIRVTLKEGSDQAEFDSALKREGLEGPGIHIQITELKIDPTRPRGPLSPERLEQTFGEKYDGYLRKGWLRIKIQCGSETYDVVPHAINLPRLAKGLERVGLPGQPGKVVGLNHLYFDPSGRGVVTIRHTGVAIVEDVKTIVAYGLEESVYAGGYVKGFIDADFLEPLPARTGFEESADWVAFLDLLDKHRPQIEAEVEILRQEQREKLLSEIQRAAIRLAREILDSEGFRDLELPGGTARTKAPPEKERTVTAGRQTGERSKEPGDQQQTGGLRINYLEKNFDTPKRHSQLAAGGVVEVNNLNPDFKREMAGLDEEKLAYATLMIGKEVIAYNDRSKTADDYLERLLGFHFSIKEEIGPCVAVPGKRGRGRPRKLV